MNYGKLTENIYNRSVVKVIKANGAGLKTVCAALPYIEDTLQWSFISGQASAHGSDMYVARRAFLAAVNRLVIQCSNIDLRNENLKEIKEQTFETIKSICANLTLLIPQRLREIKVRTLMEQAAKSAAQLAIPFADIDVQVLPCVQEPVASCTVEGWCPRCRENNARAGEDIVMTKWLGLEGTAWIADNYFSVLCSRYPADIVEEARGFGQYCCILPEAATAMKSNAGALYAVRESGIFGGLWSLAAKSGVGLVVDLNNIPIRQETIEICTFFDCNPYELLAGGSLLITIQDGRELVHTLNSQGIPAVIIGKITEGNDRIIRHGDETRFLESAIEDAVYHCNAIAMQLHCNSNILKNRSCVSLYKK